MAEGKKVSMVKLVECPRDAMQGWPHFIPTETKINFIQALLEVGFNSLDFGSFVSHKSIPQLADTKEVIESLEMGNSKTRLLSIVANTRGAKEAAAYPKIQDIGFPFSISETFQQRNTNSSIENSVHTVSDILSICSEKNKRLVVYISMAFGNPYGDDWSEEYAMSWIRRLVNMGVEVVSLADTVGLASPDEVYSLTKSLITEFTAIESGVHLHSRKEMSVEKLDAAFSAGCLRFDGALNGIGGCPMAGDALVGNMDTLMMIDYFRSKDILPPLSKEGLLNSMRISAEIFLNH